MNQTDVLEAAWVLNELCRHVLQRCAGVNLKKKKKERN